MASAPRNALPLTALTVVAAALLLPIGWAIAPRTENAQAMAIASADCRGVTLKPASKSVRRGGWTLLRGRVCGAVAMSSGANSVQVELRNRRSWSLIGTATAESNGRFSVCARVRVSRRVRVARIRATSSSGATASATLRVSAKGNRDCQGASDSGVLSVLREDPGTNPNPIPLWGGIDAADSSRHQQFPSGGPDGGPFRRLTVKDGDDDWGERAELAYNTWHKNTDGSLGAPWSTFFVYNEGNRRVTEFWVRLPSDFPLSTSAWQCVMQMKQAGPSSGSSGSPVLALEARQGQWQLQSYGTSDSPKWSAPAKVGVWTHFSFDITSSVDPSKGKVKVTSQELGGAERVGPQLKMRTLKPEEAPGNQGIFAGQAIPSHLRLGVYHNPSLPGTHVDYADTRVLG